MRTTIKINLLLYFHHHILKQYQNMSSSRNWSHNSFEDTMEKFVPLIKLWWMKHMKIIPVNYSEWSDTIYVIVEFEMTGEGEQMARDWNYIQQQEITSMIAEYIKKYFRGYLNTNVAIQEFRRPANYTMSQYLLLVKEVIRKILREGMQISDDAPDWVKEFHTLPREGRIAQIQKNKKRIEKLLPRIVEFFESKLGDDLVELKISNEEGVRGRH